MNVSLNATALNSTTDMRPVTLFSLVSFLCIAIIILPIGIAGNLLVIIVVKKKRYLRTKTNFLLANLAASDLMANVLAYTVGIARAFPIPSRTLGRFLCKINSYYPAASFCSILTLTAIAVERYSAIVKPFSSGLKFGTRTLRYFIIAIWILSIASATPLVFFDEYNSEHVCIRTWSTNWNFAFWTCAIVLGIALPVLVIVYCYFRIIRALYFGCKVIPMNIPLEVDAQEKKKVIKLSIIVTSVLIIAFTPFAVVRQLEIHGPVPSEVTVLALCLILLSSVLNPFIYAFQSTNYRQAFKETIFCCVMRRWPYDKSYQKDRTVDRLWKLSWRSKFLRTTNTLCRNVKTWNRNSMNRRETESNPTESWYLPQGRKGIKRLKLKERRKHFAYNTLEPYSYCHAVLLWFLKTCGRNILYDILYDSIRYKQLSYESQYLEEPLITQSKDKSCYPLPI